MFQRSLFRCYSGHTQIYSMRTINKLSHMGEAAKLKSEYLAAPESTYLFVEYLKELNKAGQKDLVKIEVDRYKGVIQKQNFNDYLKLQSQYEVAEHGRYRKYRIPLFSTLFFMYLGWFVASSISQIFYKSDEDNPVNPESKNKDSSEVQEDKSKGWSFSISWGSKDEDKDKEGNATDNATEAKTDDESAKDKSKKFKFNLSIGKKKKEEGTPQDPVKDKNDLKANQGDSNKAKTNEQSSQDKATKNDKTWLFQDAIQGEPLPQKDVDVRFQDILGIDEFKHEFEEIVDFLKNPSKYENAGARIPKGILLVGNPGCGKTLMAKALAGESNCSFFYKSGAEFEEVYVGVGARRMRDLFKAAKKHAPSIIFIDEIDSIAGQRSATQMSENRQCINQLLAEMDGFRKNDSVIVVAATNLEGSLDPAVKRSGRFDKIVRIPLPDIKGRELILNHFGKKIEINGVDLGMQARRTIGFSGADLKNFLNTAILHGVRMDRDHANQDDFDFAYDRIKMGIRKKGILADDGEKRATAIHEIGHAMICTMTEGSLPLYKVTIMPSGSSLGHTAMVPEKDMLTQTKKNIEAAIDVALGGRAAEELFLGEDLVTTGCSSDLQNATNMAYAYIRDLGMKENSVFINEKSENLSEAYKFKVDLQVQSLLQESLHRTKSMLKSKEPQIMKLVDALIEKETLSAEEFKSYL